MTQAYVPLLIKQGDTFTRVLTVTNDAGVPRNLTGATLTLHLRAQGAATDTLAVPLTITGAASGEALLSMTATQTATLEPATQYTYEVEYISGAEVLTVVEGALSVLADRG